VEQIVARQTNINANLLRKVSVLEKTIHTMSNHRDRHHPENHQQQQQQRWWQHDAERTQNDAPAPGLLSSHRMYSIFHELYILQNNSTKNN